MNRKAAEAKAIADAAKQERQKKEAKEAEDAKWNITDKKELDAIRKRKEQQEKADGEKRRKAEQKLLFEKDQESYVGKNSQTKQQSTKKLSKAEIQARLLLKNMKPAAPTAPSDGPGGATIQQNFDDVNYNKLRKEVVKSDRLEGRDNVEAKDVDEALELFEKEDIDVNPEKRRKAAFEAYLSTNLPRIKEDKPGLRLNQYKNMLFKEFQTSKENPVYAAQLAQQFKK